MTPKQANAQLKPLNAVIQICPNCGKIDVYKNDRHSCRDHITMLINRGYDE